MSIILKTTLIICFVFLLSCSSDTIKESELSVAFNDQNLEVQVMDIVNTHRESMGLTKLKFNETAYTYANNHNDYMILQGSISHDNFSSRASKITFEVNAKVVGENVATGYLSAESVFNGWITSTEHKATIESDFTHAAISAKKNSIGKIYFTHIFYK